MIKISHEQNFFNLFDKMVADWLEVSVDTYIETIDKFNDEDMEFIIEAIIDPRRTEEDKFKAKELFKTKL